MRRRGRDQDRQPVIELLDAPASEDRGVRIVQVGPRGGRGPRPRRGSVALAAGAGAVLLVSIVSVVATAGGDEEARPGPSVVPATTSPRPPSSRPQRPEDPASESASIDEEGDVVPLVPDAVGMGLVLVGPRRLEVVELATGRRWEVETSSPIGGDVWQAVPFGPGRVAIVSADRARMVDLATGELSDLGTAHQLQAVPGRDLAWLLQFGVPEADGKATASLVDPTGRELTSFAVDSEHLLGADAQGIVTTRFDTAYFVDADGPRSLGHGIALAAGSGWAAVATCGADGACGVVSVDLATGQRTPLPLDLDAANWYPTVHVGPEGQVALLTADHVNGGWQSFEVADRDGQVIVSHDFGPGTSGGRFSGWVEPVFLPDWSGVIFHDHPRGRLSWIPLDGGTPAHELPGAYGAETVVAVELP